MVYNFVLIDRIFCESYIEWTYEESDSNSGRDGVFNLHLQSAMKKSNEEKCLLMMTSITREELEKKYSEDDRNMWHLSSIVEASEEIKMPLPVEEVDSILKGASWLKWKGIQFCILTGNSLLYNLAKKQGFEVYFLRESEEVLNAI